MLPFLEMDVLWRQKREAEAAIDTTLRNRRECRPVRGEPPPLRLPSVQDMLWGA